MSGVVFAADAPALVEPLKSRDRRVVKRWKIAGSPRGLALADNGIVYVGLSDRQSVVALKAADGTLLNETILDDEEIASTKELVALRLTADQSRLVVANGSDESVTLLELPALKITREIGLEGEAIRDALPDPAGKYLYVLGSQVHVFDFDGQRELRTLDIDDPMTIATTSDGSLLAVTFKEKFESGPASSVAIFETATFKEIAREPLETDREIRSAVFGAGDQALVFVADDWIAEKVLQKRTRELSATGGTMRIRFGSGDFVSSQKICLVEKAGPQVITLGRTSSFAIVPEKRCSRTGAFTAQPRRVTSASLYNVGAFALAYDRERDAVWATDPDGYLTMYKTPSPEKR